MRPFCVVHSNVFLTGDQPWPLQAFWPLQDDESCDLQALCPLHALMPAHLIVLWALAVAIEPAANSAAAAATMVLLFKRFSPVCVARIGELPKRRQKYRPPAEMDNGFAIENCEPSRCLGAPGH
jgi:hypothetical protein